MLNYHLLYRLGFTPWNRLPGPAILHRLMGDLAPPSDARALDIACGTGRDAVHLALHGWDVTGFDFDERALAKARARAEEEGVTVDLRMGDVTRMHELGLEPGFSLLYDLGCIHGLPDEEARRAADGIAALAADGATLVVMAFERKNRRLLPRGMDREHVADLFADGWRLEEDVDVVGLAEGRTPTPIRRAHPTAYRLVRTAQPVRPEPAREHALAGV